MRTLAAFVLSSVVACSGGNDTPPAPEPEPAPAPAPPPPKPADKDTDLSSMSEEDQKAFLMTYGKKVYETGDGGIACTTCHGAEGKGTPGAFPPLVGQKDHMGDCTKHAGIVIHGLRGEIVVDGTTYNAVMTPQGAMLNDLQIAAVISYERQSWGNDFGYCFPKDVSSAR